MQKVKKVSKPKNFQNRRKMLKYEFWRENQKWDIFGNFQTICKFTKSELVKSVTLHFLLCWVFGQICRHVISRNVVSLTFSLQTFDLKIFDLLDTWTLEQLIFVTNELLDLWPSWHLRRVGWPSGLRRRHLSEHKVGVRVLLSARADTCLGWEPRALSERHSWKWSRRPPRMASNCLDEWRAYPMVKASNVHYFYGRSAGRSVAPENPTGEHPGH